jgi:hypothetical protein
MYPAQLLREAAQSAGKNLATYFIDVPADRAAFTCWGPNFGTCGVHSVRISEVSANVAALADRYHVVRQ